MVSNCAKWLEVVCATLIKSAERRAPSAERRAPSAEAMTAPRAREQADPPSPPDRLPPRRGGSPSSKTASAAARSAGFARLAGARRGLVRSARVLAAAALLALCGGLALPATAQAAELVSNFDEVGNSSHSFRNVEFGQGFTTGRSAAGFPLTSIEVKLIGDPAGVTATATVRRADSSGNPGDDATVAYFDGDETALPDVSTGTSDHQVNIAVGPNTVKVKVTAPDGMTEKTYTVIVTRDRPTLSQASVPAGGTPVALQWQSPFPTGLGTLSAAAVAAFTVTADGVERQITGIVQELTDNLLNVTLGGRDHPDLQGPGRRRELRQRRRRHRRPRVRSGRGANAASSTTRWAHTRARSSIRTVTC